MNEAKSTVMSQVAADKGAIRRAKAAKYRRESLIRLKQDPEKYAAFLEKDRRRCILRQQRIGKQIRERDRKNYAKDPTRKLVAATRYYHESKENDPSFIERKRELSKKRYERDTLNPELMARRAGWRKKWRDKVFADSHRLTALRKKRAKYARVKRRTDPMFRMASHLRARLCSLLAGKSKQTPTLALVGCSLSFLKGHLEASFDKRMNWDNYGSYWHVDHIIPLCAFDLSDSKQLSLAMNWQNLQPLEAIANKSKNGKITHPQLHLPLLQA
jgi:hypothetical protein